MKVDYIAIMPEYHGRNDGFLTDAPMPTKLSSDGIVKVRYDVQSMRWIANRPSKITYPV
ncbi:MAG: hypothetical protein ACE5PV_26835 [Candidatus Poribacteria bacterium]